MGRFRLYTFLAGLVIAVVGFLVVSPEVNALSGNQFKAGRIIDDSVFFNGNAMTASQIQTFLNSKVPVCDTNGTQPYGGTTRKAYAASRGVSTPFICLKDYRMNTPSKAGESGLCSALTAKSNRTAAQIIDDVSRACGVSQKALIVLLQKEQSLITDDWPWPIQYNTATGYGCPDSGPNNSANCNSQYYGFFNQVYLAARVFKWYALDPVNNNNYQPKANNSILYNPNTSCGRSTVYIENQATAGLYNYTPYQPNAAALNNLYGEGNSCSAYGNRNFWRMFNDWFGPTTDSPLFRIGDSKSIYILGSNNNYYGVPSSKVLRAYGFGSNVNLIRSFSSSYVRGKTYSGNLPLLARFGGEEIYLMDRGTAHHFTSRELLEEYGYEIGQEAYISAGNKYYYPDAEDVQTTIQNLNGHEVWHVESAKKRHITDRTVYTTAGNPTYSNRIKVTLSEEIAGTIPNGAPILGSNKLLRRSDTNTYAFWDGSVRRNVSNRVISELGLTADYSSRSNAIDQLTASGSSIDKLVKDNSNNLFLLDTRKKFLVSPSDLTHLGLTTNSFITTPTAFLNKVPTAGTLARVVRIGNNDAVYLVANSKRYHLTSPAAVSERGFTLNQVTTINASSATLFPDSGRKILSLGTLFRIGSSSTVNFVNTNTTSISIPNREVLNTYGLRMDKVLTLTSGQASNYPRSGNLGFFFKSEANTAYAMKMPKQKIIASNTMLSADYFNKDLSRIPVIDNQLTATYQTGNNLTDLVKQNDDAKVYIVEAGVKKWVSTRAVFESRNLSYNNVTVVSRAFLDSLPTGPRLN